MEIAELKAALSFYEALKNNVKTVIRNQTDDDIVIEGMIVSELEKQFMGDAVVSANDVRNALAERKGNIRIRLNSPGGSFDEASVIVNLIEERTANGDEVTVIVDGVAASAGALIALAGSKVLMGTYARIMVHRAWSRIAGNAITLRKQANVQDKVDMRVAGMLAEIMTVSVDEALAMLTKETWFLADEAIEQGLAEGMAFNYKPNEQIQNALNEVKGEEVTDVHASNSNTQANASQDDDEHTNSNDSETGETQITPTKGKPITAVTDEFLFNMLVRGTF